MFTCFKLVSEWFFFLLCFPSNLFAFLFHSHSISLECSLYLTCYFVSLSFCFFFLALLFHRMPSGQILDRSASESDHGRVFPLPELDELNVFLRAWTLSLFIMFSLIGSSTSFTVNSCRSSLRVSFPLPSLEPHPYPRSPPPSPEWFSSGFKWVIEWGRHSVVGHKSEAEPAHVLRPLTSLPVAAPCYPRVQVDVGGSGRASLRAQPA